MVWRRSTIADITVDKKLFFDLFQKLKKNASIAIRMKQNGNYDCFINVIFVADVLALKYDVNITTWIKTNSWVN